MTPPAESEGSPVAVPEAVTVPGSAAPAVASSGTQTGRDDRLAREPVWSTVVIGVLGGLMTALVGVLGALLVWQLSAIGGQHRQPGHRTEVRDQQSARRAAVGVAVPRLAVCVRSWGPRLAVWRAELGSEIGSLRSEMRSEIGSLRTEMQAGFREINATLLDHTDRLARLEAAAGLARADESSTGAIHRHNLLG